MCSSTNPPIYLFIFLSNKLPRNRSVNLPFYLFVIYLHVNQSLNGCTWATWFHVGMNACMFICMYWCFYLLMRVSSYLLIYVCTNLSVYLSRYVNYMKPWLWRKLMNLCHDAQDKQNEVKECLEDSCYEDILYAFLTKLSTDKNWAKPNFLIHPGILLPSPLYRALTPQSMGQLLNT